VLPDHHDTCAPPRVPETWSLPNGGPDFPLFSRALGAPRSIALSGGHFGLNTDIVKRTPTICHLAPPGPPAERSGLQPRGTVASEASLRAPSCCKPLFGGPRHRALSSSPFRGFR
jgi:hypothetical protein